MDDAPDSRFLTGAPQGDRCIDVDRGRGIAKVGLERPGAIDHRVHALEVSAPVGRPFYVAQVELDPALNGDPASGRVERSCHAHQLMADGGQSRSHRRPDQARCAE